MNQYEAEIWRQLCSPFPANAYKSRQGSGNRQYMYIPPRVLMNRLDDVLGPRNWTTDLDPTERGVIIRLTLNMPVYDETGTVTGRQAVWRCGSGAFQDAGGGLTPDGVMKGAESNAFRKACSTFGITRDLYGEGMPGYIADLFGGIASGTPQLQPVTPAPQQSPGYQQSQQGNQQAGQESPRFDPPFNKPGKNVYAWSKGLSNYFQYDLLGTMIGAATAAGLPKFTDQWPPDFVNKAVAIAIVAASRLPTYKGELDQWLPNEQQTLPMNPQPQTHQTSPAEKQAAAYSGQNYADAVHQNIKNSPQAQAPIDDANGGIKQAIAVSIKALVTSKVGRTPTTQEILAALGEISANSMNASGARGEVLPSLRLCADTRWLKNMKVEVEKQIADLAHQRAMGQQEDDGLPC